MGSQSSTGSSTLSTIHGLKEISKVILSNNVNPRKELLSNRDNKVYSYKLNQLISIIKSSQTNKKPIKKKSTVTAKMPTSANSRKVCRKVTKTNRKLPKKQSSKSSLVSKCDLFISIGTIPKHSYLNTSEKEITDLKAEHVTVAKNINETRKNKVMKKLGSQINKNLEFGNVSNISEFYTKQISTSPNKRVNISSSRKKPPLVKVGGSQAGKMLRYPSNTSNPRNTSYSVKSNSSNQQMVLPSKGQK